MILHFTSLAHVLQYNTAAYIYLHSQNYYKPLNYPCSMQWISTRFAAQC